MKKKPEVATDFVDTVLRVIRDEISSGTLRVYYGQVGSAASNGLNVSIEGNWVLVQWTAAGVSVNTGDVVMLVGGPGIPLTILCKRVKTY